MKVLVAGVGNVLRGDDGFGVSVARRLASAELPAGVRVVDTGIGGIALVHELYGSWDALVVLDAIDRGRPPGTVMLIKPEVVDVGLLGLAERHDMLADMHLATPARVLMLARALGILPPRVVVLGCQPETTELAPGQLSAPVIKAVEVAAAEVMRLVSSGQWPDESQRSPGQRSPGLDR